MIAPFGRQLKEVDSKLDTPCLFSNKIKAVERSQNLKEKFSLTDDPVFAFQLLIL